MLGFSLPILHVVIRGDVGACHRTFPECHLAQHSRQVAEMKVKNNREKRREIEEEEKKSGKGRYHKQQKKD